jgi:hypothetical protein
MPTDRAAPAKLPILSPRAAALSVGAFTQGPALRCAAPAGAGQALGQSDCPETDDHGAAAQAALARDLKAVAKHVPHLEAREAPELHRRSDGSYAYDGHVFQALVRPDGQVEFADNATTAQLSLSFTPVKVVADLNDLAERHILGRELYSAEKHWFLEQTRELRTQLAAEFRRRELLQANRALERTLQEVLGDRTSSTAQKHDAVFLIWQDCGEDAQERAHRQAVEAFVRRYMPQGSELGFRSEELQKLNASRGGMQPFEPYAG